MHVSAQPPRLMLLVDHQQATSTWVLSVHAERMEIYADGSSITPRASFLFEVVFWVLSLLLCIQLSDDSLASRLLAGSKVPGKRQMIYEN